MFLLRSAFDIDENLKLILMTDEVFNSEKASHFRKAYNQFLKKFKPVKRSTMDN